MKNNLPQKLAVLSPKYFGGNTETAGNNHFQSIDKVMDNISQLAEDEHQQFVQQLISAEINVLVLHDLKDIQNPDALFLNNWFSIHGDKMVLYPMWAKNRRTEINERHIEAIKDYFCINQVQDYSAYVDKNQFCEGTGSIIFDELTRKAYACESSRTSIPLFERIVSDLGYSPVSFQALDLIGRPIYHTNVMLSIGKNVAVICSESITNVVERKMVLKQLEHPDRQLIDISYNQLNHFCGNVFEVLNKQDKSFLLMSNQAFNHFTDEQREQISTTTKILATPINCIEQFGGGGIRCMVAGG